MSIFNMCMYIYIFDYNYIYIYIWGFLKLGYLYIIHCNRIFHCKKMNYPAMGDPPFMATQLARIQLKRAVSNLWRFSCGKLVDKYRWILEYPSL